MDSLKIPYWNNHIEQRITFLVCFATKIQRRSSVTGFFRFSPSSPVCCLHRLTKICLYVESKYVIYIWRFFFQTFYFALLCCFLYLYPCYINIFFILRISFRFNCVVGKFKFIVICNFLMLFIQCAKRRFLCSTVYTQSFRFKPILNGSLSLAPLSFFFQSRLIREVRSGQRPRSRVFVRTHAENHCNDL